MKHIGIISDTHSYLDEKVFKYFAECDEIWHAGDIGIIEVANKLKDFKPFKAVYGNIDGGEVRSEYSKELFFECEGQKVYITHIAGTPSKYNSEIRARILELKPTIFICGHSHQLKIFSDKLCNNMLFINPGAAGKHGFHHVKTLVRMKLDAGKIFDVQVIELGKRAEIEL